MRKAYKAFSMVEVMVASVILMTTIVLVFGAISFTRQPVERASRKLLAAKYGQEVLDALRGRVNASEWDPSAPDSVWRLDTDLPLSGLAGISPPPEGVGGTYRVTDKGGYRKVTVNVTFNEG